MLKNCHYEKFEFNMKKNSLLMLLFASAEYNSEVQITVRTLFSVIITQKKVKQVHFSYSEFNLVSFANMLFYK